jgi:hypothetical protein
VIRPDKPEGWDPIVYMRTDYERLMYQLTLSWPTYKRNNRSVFPHLECCGTDHSCDLDLQCAPARDGHWAMTAHEITVKVMLNLMSGPQLLSKLSTH